MNRRQHHIAAQETARFEQYFQREYDDQQRRTNEVAHRTGITNNRLGRLPIFQRRGHDLEGLRVPYESNDPQEVFGEDFYELFPWARGIDPFDDKATQWEPAEWYVENSRQDKGLPSDEDAEVPPAIAFVNNLISLELDDLDEDSQACPICLQKY